MRTNQLLLLLLLSTKSIAQKEIRFYAAANATTPKERFTSYKGEVHIEGALGFYLGTIKLSDKFAIGLEPIGKLKWYGLENLNIVKTDYSISTTEVGSRAYPMLKIGKGILRRIAQSIYIDLSYSKIKLVKVDIANDEIINTLSYGYGINLPIYDMSDLGIVSELTLNAGVQQYGWTTPAGSKSSFSGTYIGLSFAIQLDISIHTRLAQETGGELALSSHKPSFSSVFISLSQQH